MHRQPPLLLSLFEISVKKLKQIAGTPRGYEKLIQQQQSEWHSPAGVFFRSSVGGTETFFLGKGGQFDAFYLMHRQGIWQQRDEKFHRCPRVEMRVTGCKSTSKEWIARGRLQVVLTRASFLLRFLRKCLKCEDDLLQVGRNLRRWCAPCHHSISHFFFHPQVNILFFSIILQTPFTIARPSTRRIIGSQVSTKCLRMSFWGVRSWR